MSHIYPNVCNIWLRSDGRVERNGGYRHTDSWHEWGQDNFYGRSATKRIVIKEPSLVYCLIFLTEQHNSFVRYTIFIKHVVINGRARQDDAHCPAVTFCDLTVGHGN